jgi:hypothetical protein
MKISNSPFRAGFERWKERGQFLSQR